MMGLFRVVIEKRSSARYRVDGKRGLVWITALATLLWLSPAYGRTVIENFDNGTYNQNLFFPMTSGSPNQPTVTVVSNQLQVKISGPINDLFAGGLEMLGNFQLTGNFDIQVDFNLVAWPTDSAVGAGIVSPLFDVRRLASNGQPGVTDTYFFGIPGKSITNVPTSDVYGKLRLTRKGSTVQAFYWGNNAWQPIGVPQTDATLKASTNVYIGVYGNGFLVQPPLTVAFDNLKIVTPDACAAILPLILE